MPASTSLLWVPAVHPQYGMPGFVGYPLTAARVVPPLPPSTEGPHINQPYTAFWPPPPPLSPPGTVNALIETHALRGIPLPNGEFLFTPPLLLRDINALLGSGRTVLRPDPRAPLTSEPRITIESTLPGNAETRYPLPARVEHLFLDGHHDPGSRGQVGIRIVGANISFTGVTIDGFGHGLNIRWGVNISFFKCSFINNDVGVLLGGLLRSTASGTANVCHIDFEKCRFAHSSNAGVIVNHGYRVPFDKDIFENNPGKGLIVTSHPDESPIKDVLLRDCWFELNGASHHYHIDDALGILKREGVTGSYDWRPV